MSGNSTYESFFIPHVGLSKKEKIEIKKIISRSSLILKNYHDKVDQEKNKVNRFNFFLNILKKNKNIKEICVFGVRIEKADAEEIKKIKSLEWRVLQGHSNLMFKLSKKWSMNNIKNDPCLCLEDIQSEATKAVIQSLPYYTDTNVELSTFLYHNINRHLCRFCNKTNGMSNFSDKILQLKMKYEQLSNEEGSSFDSTIKKMKLSDKEIFNLCRILNNIKNISSMCKEEVDQVVFEDNKFFVPDFESNAKIMDAISKIEFSNLEKAVLEGVLQSSSCGKNLGLSSFSKKLINPKTQKPYSRMAFSNAWKKIKNKIKKEYKKVA